jgi:hypothetical protein
MGAAQAQAHPERAGTPRSGGSFDERHAATTGDVARGYFFGLSG